MTNKNIRRVTGSADIDLTAEGRKQAKEMAARITKPFDAVFCGPETRMVETAKFFGDPIILAGLDAWKRGEYEGKPAASLKDQMRDLMIHPDKVPPGKGEMSGERGESHNKFLKPLVMVFEWIKQHTKPGERVLIVTSGGGLQALDAYLKGGSPKALVFDRRPMAMQSYWSDLGQLFLADKKGLKKVSDNEPKGVYATEHGATAWNSAEEKKQDPKNEDPG